MLYHGVSAMAMKGLVDMGANIGSNSDQSFSQLPTQSVCLSRDFNAFHVARGLLQQYGCDERLFHEWRMLIP